VSDFVYTIEISKKLNNNFCFIRKTCKNCNCSKEDHNIIDDIKYYNLKERIGSVYDYMEEKRREKINEQNSTLNSLNSISFDRNIELDAKYDWYPKGIDVDLVRLFRVLNNLGLSQEETKISIIERWSLALRPTNNFR
jgi:hypothetical protein